MERSLLILSTLRRVLPARQSVLTVLPKQSVSNEYESCKLQVVFVRFRRSSKCDSRLQERGPKSQNQNATDKAWRHGTSWVREGVVPNPTGVTVGGNWAEVRDHVDREPGVRTVTDHGSRAGRISVEPRSSCRTQRNSGIYLEVGGWASAR